MDRTAQVAYDPDMYEGSEFYSLDEALARLGIGRTLGYGLARNNGFPFPVHRVGRKYRVSKKAFAETMHGREATPAGVGVS